MGLYKRHPVFCTAWAFLEVVLFAGVIFGWGSLVYVLKEEGFYIEVCSEESGHDTEIIAEIPNLRTNNSGAYSIVDSTLGNEINDSSSARTAIVSGDGTQAAADLLSRGCQAQESALNLWFTISVSFMYLSFAVIGNAQRLAGLRIIRSVFIVIYLIGTLCLALATPDIPWLILPGLCCIGCGGMTILSTNLQIANLQPRYRSTIVAIFTGLFDFSSVNKQLIRIAFEHGVPRRTSYLLYAGLCLVLVGISTCFFLPKESVTEKHIAKVEKYKRTKKGPKPRDNDKLDNNVEVLLKSDDKELEALGVAGIESTISVKVHPHTEPLSLCWTILSSTFLLHLCWLSVHALRFVTFIGLVNAWLEDLLQGDEVKVGELLGVFSYMTMGAIGTALLCGLIYDWQRRRYANAPGRQRTYLPVILPMCLVILFSMTTTVLCQVRHWISPYLAFGVFTFLRSWLFTVAVAFLGDTFAIEYFGVLFGLLQFVAGLAGLLQYPVFEWYNSSQDSPTQVNMTLLVLQAATFLHPAVMWLRCRKDTDPPANQPFNTEIHVTPHCA